MSAGAEIISLAAPVMQPALDQLADVLVDCVEGGASVSFMSPFSRDSALGFFRKVERSVAAGDTVLLAARSDGTIVGTVQLGLDTPPNQPHRADIKKMLVHRSARGRGIGAALASGARHRSRRKRSPALSPRRLDAERDRSGLCAVSRWPALRHRLHVEAAGEVILGFNYQPSSPRKRGPIRRVVRFGARGQLPFSTTQSGGYGSLLSQGRRSEETSLWRGYPNARQPGRLPNRSSPACG